jgi:hypothetical protein
MSNVAVENRILGSCLPPQCFVDGGASTRLPVVLCQERAFEYDAVGREARKKHVIACYFGAKLA